MKPRTLFEKVWERHVIDQERGKPAILYIDLHLIHEVTSPQAFEGLRLNGRKVRRPDMTIATMDHNVPTINRHLPVQTVLPPRRWTLWSKIVRNLEFVCMIFTVPDRESFT